MGGRVSAMSDEPTLLVSTVNARRVVFLGAVISIAASSTSVTASPPQSQLLAAPITAAALTSCFVSAERPSHGCLLGRRHSCVLDRNLRGKTVTTVKDGMNLPFSRLNFRSGSNVNEIIRDGSVSSGKKKRLSRRRRRSAASEVFDPDEYERRKKEWAAIYTDVSTLRLTFGTNRNKLWGDFDPETTRRLYHTLLPRALMALNDLGIMTEKELAPLAYEARNAAKKYARERSMVPGRVLSMCYDGFRSWRTHGKWNIEGLTWEQIWEKYEQQIIKELSDDHDDTELTRKVCLRILERSCRTNPTVDKIILGEVREDSVAEAEGESIPGIVRRKDIIRRQQQIDVAAIAAQLERDVNELLFEGIQQSLLFEPTKTTRRQQWKTERRRRKEQKKNREANRSDDEEEKIIEYLSPTLHGCDQSEKKNLTPRDIYRLRMIAVAKKRFAILKRAEKLLQITSRSTPFCEAESSLSNKTQDSLDVFTSDVALRPRHSRITTRERIWEARNNVLHRRREK